MMKSKFIVFSLLLGLVFSACSSKDEENILPTFELTTISVNGVVNQNEYEGVNPELMIDLVFSEAIDLASVDANVQLKNSEGLVDLEFTVNDTKLTVKPKVGYLKSFDTYTFIINTGLRSKQGILINTGKVYTISTSMDMSDKFPRIETEELLELTQKKTFKYFWDFGHPTSGMARERTVSGNTVTTGGTGFGVMTILVALERGWISRQEALDRVQTIVSFLKEKSTRYHGAYAHWINGETGATIPFSQYDNGADLVETSLLMQGLLACRSYFSQSSGAETKLRADITELWEAVEWDWFLKDGGDVLYWHWSPDYGWQMNLKIQGWNESLITYVLATSSPTYPISKEVYDKGWARNGQMKNGQTYYNYTLPLGEANGGALFFSHYSFLGIDPNGLADQYANYKDQVVNHTLINYSYCVANPKGFTGYSTDCWGLTASDGDKGYSAYSPNNDKGVIAPTAALSSMPYTPNQSLKALEFFYYKLGDKLWGDYGFYDAFNLSEGWFADQQIAINQGPIVIMIENHRTGLLWNTFMKDEDVKKGLKNLGFSSPRL